MAQIKRKVASLGLGDGDTHVEFHSMEDFKGAAPYPKKSQRAMSQLHRGRRLGRRQ